jgi:hypothetical protein
MRNFAIASIAGNSVYNKQLLLVLSFLFFFSFQSSNLLSQSCDFGTCLDYTTLIDIDNIPDCDSVGVNFNGDIDNNSDCNNPNVPPGTSANCYTWVIYKSPTSSIVGIFGQIGQGNGCNGEIDDLFSEVDIRCTSYGSSGSQNEYFVSFENSDTIRITICDGSSGQVSICGLCAVTPALPVEFSKFDVFSNRDKVELSWETMVEVNNDGFVIERSIDGESWTEIGFIKGAGTTSEINRYSFSDEYATHNLLYYRLKQLDYSGSFSYSEIKEIRFEADSEEFMLIDAIKYGEYYNQLGRRVYEKNGLLFIHYKGKTHKVFFPALD